MHFFPIGGPNTPLRRRSSLDMWCPGFGWQRSGREVDADGSVALLRKRHQEVVVDHRLSGSWGSHDQYGHLMWQIRPEEEELAWRLCRGYDKIRHLRETDIKEGIKTVIYPVILRDVNVFLYMFTYVFRINIRFIFKVFLYYNINYHLFFQLTNMLRFYIFS